MPEKSGFNAITLNVSTSTIDTTLLQYSEASGRYTAAGSPVTRPFLRNQARISSQFPPTKEYEEFLQELGMTFNHPTKESLCVQDVFVCPDFREVHEAETPESRTVRGEALMPTISRFRKVVLLGPENIGKSVLLKYVCRNLIEGGMAPLFLKSKDFAQLKKGFTKAFLHGLVSAQYEGQTAETYLSRDKSHRSVVIDDYQELRIPNDEKVSLLASLEEMFEVVVMAATDDVRLEEFSKRHVDEVTLYDFKHLEIMDFGFALRSKLVAKWYQGVEGRSGLAAPRLGHIESQINAVIGEQLIPPYPMYILFILQQLDTMTVNQLHMAGNSLGFVYDTLVVHSLSKSTVDDTDIDTNKTYLSELAYELFCEREQHKPLTVLHAWHKRHCEKYQVSIDFDRHLDAMIKASLLLNNNGLVSFRYPYLYYYFVAQYLSRHMSSPETQDHLRKLASYLHHIEAANIVLFTCHLSKDDAVLNAVIATADALFKSRSSSGWEIGSASPQLIERVIDDSHDRESNRQESLQVTDEAMRSVPSIVDVGVEDDVTYISECDVEALDDQQQLSSALKTVQIIGQILKNHVGSLEGPMKERLVRSCADLGLRAMSCLLSHFQEGLDEMVDVVVEALERKGGGVPKQKMIEDVNRSLWNIAEMGIVAIIKYTSESLGCERLSPIFDSTLSKDQRVPVRAVDLSIKLDHYRGFPEKEALSLAADVQDDMFAFAVIRDLVWMRFYLYDTDYRIRQKMCTKFQISQKGQQKLLQNASTRRKYRVQ